MRLWHTFVYRLLKIFLFLLGRLPLSLRRRLGKGIGSLIYLVPTRERRIAELQLKAFLPNCDINKTVKGVYQNFGMSFMETINMKPMLDDDSFVEFDTNSLSVNFQGPPKGAILITAHVSNWDFLAAYLIRHGMPLATAAREARNPALEKLIADIRSGYGAEVISRASRAGALGMIRATQRGVFAAGLIDQDTDVRAVMVPFFGQKVSTPNGLVTLAQRYGCKICSIFIFRKPDGRFKIIAEAFDHLESEYDILCEYHRRLEALIRMYPEQWIWVHKRWRTTSEGTRLGSKEYMKYLEQLAGSAS